MTNEQLTQEVMNMKEHLAKGDAEKENILSIMKEMQEEIKSTKSLAEDVHIMAINMQNMQETLTQTNKKVDALTSKEFVEYKENKKLVKQNVISKITGGVVGFALSGLAWLFWFYLNNK